MAAGLGSGPLEKLSLTATKGIPAHRPPERVIRRSNAARETSPIFRQTVVVRATSASSWIAIDKLRECPPRPWRVGQPDGLDREEHRSRDC